MDWNLNRHTGQFNSLQNDELGQQAMSTSLWLHDAHKKDESENASVGTPKLPPKT